RKQKMQNMALPAVEKKEYPAVKDLFEEVRKQGRTNLLETESRAVLEQYGLPLPEGILAADQDQAVKAAEKIGFPVVLKIISPDIIHKSDFGGVELNLKTAQEVKQAFAAIMDRAFKATNKDRVHGVLISPMAAKGQECILGMTRDAQFGPVIMFGLGGVFVELLKDVSFRVAPVTKEDALEMISDTKGYKLLKGLRGEPPKDIRAVQQVLLQLSEIALSNPEIKEIDLNPVIVHEQGLSIVDSRIILTSK
ncbi:MAG: acetate--CoA ligase family protein, partial [Desulfobacterales bacterium]